MNVPIVTVFKDASLPQQSTQQEVFDFIVKKITENMDLLCPKRREVIIMDVSISVGGSYIAGKMYLNAEFGQVLLNGRNVMTSVIS